MSSQSDNYTQPKGGHLCQWAIKDSPKYPMTHRITSFHCETPRPGGGTEHSCLDLGGYRIWGFGDLDTATTAGHPEKDRAFPQDHGFGQDHIHHSNGTATTTLTNRLSGCTLTLLVLSQSSCVHCIYYNLPINCNSDLKSLARCLCGG